MAITKDELLMGRDKTFADEYNDDISQKLEMLLIPLNKLRAAYGKPMKVNSGWRPPTVNQGTPNAAKGSLHLQGLACDFADPDGAIFNFCLANLQLMKDLGLYLEDPRWCCAKGGKGRWTHIQLGQPRSGKRIFVPSSALPFEPKLFNGVYDSKYDSKPIK